MYKPIVVLVIFAMLGWSQEPARVQTNRSLPIPRLDKGFVEGNTYKNLSLGLELTPDPKLKFGTPELRGKPGTVPLSVSVAAWGEFRPYSAREGTTFLATALAYYPADQRSTDACVRKVVQANRKDGFEPVQGGRESELGGTLFARTDFFKVGPVYEAVFVKACDTQALIFAFMGSDRGAVNKLIAATELKLDLPSSGCWLDGRSKK
jgi:hypothetical protein